MKFREAIAAQGENLRVSRPTIEAALGSVDLAPWSTGRLAFTGMGASSHALVPVVGHMLARGRPVIAVAADELVGIVSAGMLDAVVAVSERGTSVETLEALATVRGLPRLVVTDVADSPLARLADAIVPLGLLEDSPVYTLGYTGTLQALGLLEAALQGEPLDRSWDALPHIVERTLEAAAEAIARLAVRIETPHAVDFVGSGAHLAAALEGGLVCREASRLPTSCHSTRQYLHGPMEPLDERLLAVVIGDGRELRLALDVAATGAHVLLVTTAEVTPCANLTVIRLPALSAVQLAVLEVLPIQLLAEEIATRHELAVEGFRYEQTDTKAANGPMASLPSAGRVVSRTGSLGIDIGGSKLAVALVTDRSGEVAFSDVTPAPSRGPGEVWSAAHELVDRAVSVARGQGIEIVGIGIAIPELVALDGRIISEVVVPGLDADEWVRRLAPVAPAVVESDVRAAATAEAICGAGRPHPSFCFVSVGTGISYCYIEGGVVHTGARGTAILLGNSVTAEWEVDGERRQWILEELASGPALLGRYVDLGGTRTTPAEILRAYGDEAAATQAVTEAARALGIGIGMIINLLDPDAVVVGGGLGSAGGPFWELTVESTREHIWADLARDVPLVRAGLGPRSAVVGAALIGWDRVRLAQTTR